MAVKESIKWILTRVHFWIVFVLWAAWDLYANYDLYGNNFSIPFMIGSIFGTFVFVFLIYVVLLIGRKTLTKKKKE